MKISLFFIVAAAAACVSAQRITTIQLDGVQYYVSRMNPYSLELNYFLAYQYCRSLGLQLISFETKEKADTMAQYLQNAGYTKFDFWTSGNKLGTDMFLWMSTGLPFNATFDYMRKLPGRSETDVPRGTEPQRIARESGESGSVDGCVVMKSPTLEWEAEDCTLFKDFICEQTRCYYYNYGSIPVSATQGNRRPYATTTTAAPVVEDKNEDKASTEDNASTSDNRSQEKVSEDPIVNRLVTAVPASVAAPESPSGSESDTEPEPESAVSESSELESEAESETILETASEDQDEELAKVSKHNAPEHIPDIASLFTTRKDSVFDGLETREVRPVPVPVDNAEDYETSETELPNNALEDSHTVGPYDGTQQDYVNDQPLQDEPSAPLKQPDDDSSTILPEAEPAYRYNIKVRSNGKVLDPPSN